MKNAGFVYAATLAVIAATTSAGAAAKAPLWAFPPRFDTAPNQTTPGSVERFSPAQLSDPTRAVDWFPGDHPPMPPAVSGGHGPLACGFCHLPQGVGRPENAALAGLPYAYLTRQIEDFKSGARKLIHPGFGPAQYMIETIDATSTANAFAAARYFSRLRYIKRVKVTEAALIPRAKPVGFVYVFDSTAAREPLGERIVEGPDDSTQFEKRDPHTTYTAYVPVGSIGRGSALAGGGADRPACPVCHGPGLKGGPTAPPIAGRYPTEIFRQLYAFRTGTRGGASATAMRGVVATLSQGDMIDLAAYVGSLEP